MTNSLILKFFQQAAPVIAAHQPEIAHLIKRISPVILPQLKKSSTSAITASLPLIPYPPKNLRPTTLHTTPIRHFHHSKTAFSKKEDKTGLFFETRFGSNSGSGFVYKPFENLEIKDGKLNYKWYEDDNWAIGTNGVDYKFNSCKIL